jgi:formyl-CoA transferase
MVASILGDFGADVIKIERPPEGDALRRAYSKDGVGLFWKVQARNKRSVTMDMGHPESREIFHQLVARADVVVENFRPGVMESWGHDWETLKGINPRLIYCRLSGWGQTGPYARRRAYGRIGEAFAGFANLTGDPDGPPMHSAMSLGDTAAAVWSAIGVLLALYWRDANGGGVGQVVDVGLYEGLFRQIDQQTIVHDQLSRILERVGNANPGVPYAGCYRTKDGRYFSFSAITVQSSLDILRSMGMADDERFNTWDACLANQPAFQGTVASWMAEHLLTEVADSFAVYEAPGTPVMNAGDHATDPHIRAREMIIRVQDEELGSVAMPGIVPKLTVSPGGVRHAAEKVGQSNRAVYQDMLGLPDEKLEELRELGAI